MKTRKVISFVTAAVMALAALPTLSAAAEETLYAIGDVDMDGIITGHDSAMVSRALFENDAELTAEEAALADINGDGIVDTTDLEWIHANEKYAIGDLRNEGFSDFGAVYFTLLYASFHHAGKDYTVYDATEITDGWSVFNDMEEGKISQLALNLMDADGNGTVDEMDVYSLMMAASLHYATYGETEIYFAKGRYDLFSSAYSH